MGGLSEEVELTKAIADHNEKNERTFKGLMLSAGLWAKE